MELTTCDGIYSASYAIGKSQFYQKLEEKKFRKLVKMN